MRVLVACEYSGTVRDAFIRAGHDAVSCDFLPSDIPGPHYQGNVFDLIHPSLYRRELSDGRMLVCPEWDLMIAHPPCTYLCNSGVRWLWDKDKNLNKERWFNMRDGALFFRELLNCNIPKIAIENPIMHKYAKEYIRQQDQIIQPWQFGHGETKATCLWLKGLPLLKPTNIVEGREARIHKLPPSKDRWKIRSTTYKGIADAMAEQWP